MPREFHFERFQLRERGREDAGGVVPEDVPPVVVGERRRVEGSRAGCAGRRTSAAEDRVGSEQQPVRAELRAELLDRAAERHADRGIDSRFGQRAIAMMKRI